MAPGFLAMPLAVVVQLGRTFTASPKKEKGRQAKKKYQATRKNKATKSIFQRGHTGSRPDGYHGRASEHGTGQQAEFGGGEAC